MSTTPHITAETIRARIAEARLHKYVVAAAARVNPITLSRLLNEREPLTAELGERILAAIARLEGEAHAR